MNNKTTTRTFDDLSTFEKCSYFEHTREAIRNILDCLRKTPAGCFQYEGLRFTLNGQAGSPKIRMHTGYKNPERISMCGEKNIPLPENELEELVATKALEYIADNRPINGCLYEIDPVNPDTEPTLLVFDEIARTRLFGEAATTHSEEDALATV